MVHPDDGILFSTKGNELASHEKTWRKLKCILLSERSQSEKATYCMIVEKAGVGGGCISGAQRIFRAMKLLRMKP